MGDGPITLTIEVVGGKFSGMTATDEDGTTYDMSLKLTARDEEKRKEKHKKPPPGTWCCQGKECQYVDGAPPCPEGFREAKTILNVRD